MNPRQSRPRFEPWSAQELRVIARHAQGVLDGRYATVSDATRACQKALARVGPTGRRARPPARGFVTVFSRISKAIAGRRFGGRYTRWSDEELAVVDRYVAGLVEGLYDLVSDAVPGCLRDIRRVLRRHSPAQRAAVGRDESAVFTRILLRAKALGWKSKREHWSVADQAVLDRHVDSLVRGKHRSSYAAARACRKDLARDRAKLRGPRHGVTRSLECVRDRIIRRARKLGWTQSATRWLPQEKRIMERHARRLLNTNGPGPTDVAGACFAELGRLHKRLRSEDPESFVRVRPRKSSTIMTYLHRRAIELGRPVLGTAWRKDELRIIDRHARTLVARRHWDAPTATRAAMRDLAALRREWRKRDPELDRRTRPRPFHSVYSQLCRSAHALRRRWPKTRWTAEELKLLNRAVDWYDRHRGQRRLRPFESALDGLLLELEQIGSLRTLTGCRARFWKEWHRRHG